MYRCQVVGRTMELPELANIGEHQMGFQRIFGDVIEGKVILEDKAVGGLSQNRKPGIRPKGE
jgi:hypothetical protein